MSFKIKNSSLKWPMKIEICKSFALKINAMIKKFAYYKTLTFKPNYLLGMRCKEHMKKNYFKLKFRT